MSLTDAVLLMTGTFVLVVVGIGLIFRISFGRQFRELAEQRQKNKESTEASRNRVIEGQKNVEQARARSEEIHRRSLEHAERMEGAMDRSDENQNRWDKSLARIEAISTD